jgi:hypothetical protein
MLFDFNSTTSLSYLFFGIIDINDFKIKIALLNKYLSIFERLKQKSPFKTTYN